MGEILSFVTEITSFRDRFWVDGHAWAPGRRRLRLSLEHRGQPIEADLAYPLECPSAAPWLGVDQPDTRFQITGVLPPGVPADELTLVLRQGRRVVRRDELFLDAIDRDPYHKLESRFFDEAGHRLLEVGSRSRSGNDRLGRIGGREYTGMDIVAGPNVDVVGDVHRLTDVVPEDSKDAVFAIAVFEHVLMPWKAALEINRVLTEGGLLFIGTHQAFPLHEVPWDYLRFSDTSWHGILNRATGFEILDTAMGEQAMIVPTVQHAATRDVSRSPAFLLVGVLARKVGAPTVTWDADLADMVETVYPH